MALFSGTLSKLASQVPLRSIPITPSMMLLGSRLWKGFCRVCMSPGGAYLMGLDTTTSRGYIWMELRGVVRVIRDGIDVFNL